MPLFTATPGLAALEDAMAARTEAEHRLHEVRARLGYLIAPEQERAIDEAFRALERLKHYQAAARRELAAAYQERR